MENELAEELEALQSVYSTEKVDVAQSERKPATLTLKTSNKPVVTFVLSGEYHTVEMT